MARLEWDLAGERFYETGVDQGVLYPRVGAGVAWNGLVSVSENSSGGELEPLYFDGVKYLDAQSSEDFQATLEAITAPSEFLACEGIKTLAAGLYASQQPRKTFGLSYRTLIGNDLVGETLGYKLHLVYNATAAPSGRNSKTISSSAEPDVRSWDIETVPVPATTYKPTAHLVIDSTKMSPSKLTVIESLLYGSDSGTPLLPTPSQLISLA